MKSPNPPPPAWPWPANDSPELRHLLAPGASHWLEWLERITALDRVSLFRFIIPRPAWGDSLVLAVALLAVNALIKPHDIGWPSLNPSPYLLLPLLIGSRYGMLAGVMAGAMGAAIVLGSAAAADFTRLAYQVTARAYQLGSFIALGGICGEIHGAWRKYQLRLAAANQRLEERIQSMDGDVALLRRCQSALEARLAATDSELCTLDTDLRRLSMSQSSELYDNLLLLLHQHTQISEAAIYELESKDKLRRQALFGSPRAFPDSLRISQLEIASLALEKKRTVTLPELSARAAELAPEHLIAIPFLDSAGEPFALLLVANMPFSALHSRAVQSMDLICRWTARLCDARRSPSVFARVIPGRDPQKLYTNGYFRLTLQLCYHSYRLCRLPSALVCFTLAGRSEISQPEFERAAMAGVRDGDCATVIEGEPPNLSVLLPLTGERGANIFRGRIVARCRDCLGKELNSRVLLFDATTQPGAIWEECVRHARNSRRRE